MSSAARAVEIARAAHAGQSDKRGGAYLDHVLRVAARVGDDPQAEIVALLHDVVEKSADWSLERLRAEGFAPAVIEAVDALTRRGSEAEEAFVARAARLPLARTVKRADILDNLESLRERGTDKAREARYEADLRQLEKAEDEGLRPPQ